MNNNESFKFFEDLVKNSSEVGVEKYGHDNSTMDADFILKYASPDHNLLDIASGSGLIVNKIEPYLKHITAIEPFQELTKHIKKSDKITVVNENVFDFTSGQQFDMITLFGFMHYLNRSEAERAYKKCIGWLKPSGKLIVKNQFGIKEDVIIDGYSKELKRDYHANYRQLDKEMELLKAIGFKKVDSFDIYPPECNRWENTHFYAIVAMK